MTAIIDYGVGNLFSLQSSLLAVGENAIVTSNKSDLENADRLILPGVGAFRDARLALSHSGLEESILPLIKEGKPILGICLGMQLLFEKDFEDGQYTGLSLIPGQVRPIKEVIDVASNNNLQVSLTNFTSSVDITYSANSTNPINPSDFKIPHIGWNSLIFTKPSKLFKYIKNGDYVYFVHSYHATECQNWTTSVTEYGAILTASVEKDNVYGTQFHPEKSSTVGLSILKAFTEIT